MAKKPKKPSAGPGAARQKALAAQSRHGSRGDFGLAALGDITSSHGMLPRTRYAWDAMWATFFTAPNLHTVFTMKDEARNTGHRSSHWGGDTRLRTRPVGFVSAGFIEPLKQQPQDDQPCEESSETGISVGDALQQSSAALAAEVGELSLETAEETLELPDPFPSSPSPAAAVVATTTASTTAGISAIETAQPEAVGFFIDVTGDKTLAANISRSPPRVPDPQTSADDSDSSTEVILFKGRNNTNRDKAPIQQKRTNPTISLDTIRYDSRAVEAGVAEDSKPSLNHALQSGGAGPRRRAKRGRFDHIDDDEEAIIADYIANMADDSDDVDEGTSQQPFLNADLGADDDDLGNGTSNSNMSSGDSAVPHDARDSDAALNDDVLGGQDSEGDDTASPTMDDETLARLLAKQEELGMGSDELLLASGAAGGRGSAYFQSGPQTSRRGKTGNNHNGSAFPSASAVADAFDDLDLMDWERPSLRNQRKRGRRGQPPVFGLSDSEMEQTLQTAWHNDRESKKSRKMRREELRAQGLLGKHADPNDPRLRYPTGMTLEDIKAEMRSFLEGSEPR